MAIPHTLLQPGNCIPIFPSSQRHVPTPAVAIGVCTQNSEVNPLFLQSLYENPSFLLTLSLYVVAKRDVIIMNKNINAVAKKDCLLNYSEIF